MPSPDPRRVRPDIARSLHAPARYLLGGALAVGLLAGCDRGDDGTEADTTPGVAAVGAARITGALSQLSDASILALVDRANLSDSATGAIAAAKATSSDLRAFAAQMVRDHHAMRLEGARVAQRLRIAPDPPADTGSESSVGETLALLNSTARGRDFDKAYIDHEVEFHLDFLETVTGAMDLASETEVKALIQKLAPMLLEHLDRAKELQARLR